MLFLHNISLTHFRNYLFRRFSFTERVVGICGANGSGKTNLLDAIYYLCYTKSYFPRTDLQGVMQDMQGFRIEGNMEMKGEAYKPVCILRENNRKEFYVNDEPYKRFSEHIGRLPCVMITPDDVALITEGSEERRKFVDLIISQVSSSYLTELIEYNKVLQQRNSLLKSAAEHNRLDETLLDTFDLQLAQKGQGIFAIRKDFLADFVLLVQEQYKSIAETGDEIVMNYYSQLVSEPLYELLKQNRQRDLYLQRTGCGIHRDDVEIMMKGQAFKVIASQGQRKSLLFALKLAEFMVLKRQKGFAPMLLLDDVFEKLDAARMNNLLHKVCVEENAQVFITDTHEERLRKVLDELHIHYQLTNLRF